MTRGEDQPQEIVAEAPKDLPKYLFAAIGAREKLRPIRDHLIFVVTNQAGIARGRLGLVQVEAALRELERKFRLAASANPNPIPPTDTPSAADLAAAVRRARPEYDAYKDAVIPVRIGFESVTGRAVNDADIEPAFRAN